MTPDRVAPVKVLTWNVNGRIGDAAKRQISAVMRRDPDVICLQECSLQRPVEALELDGWHSRSGSEQSVIIRVTIVEGQKDWLWWEIFL